MSDIFRAYNYSATSDSVKIPDIDFEFLHTSNTFEVSLDTREVREVLGPEIPLSEPEILLWIADNLSEQNE